MLALSLSALAQTPRVHLWAAGDSVGVRLLWTLPFDRPLPREYALLRRDSRRNVYEPLTTVQRPTRERWTPWIPADAPPGAVDTLELFIKAAEDPTTPDTLRRQVLSLLQEALLDDPQRTAHILGVSYHDTTARRGRRYDYALMIGGETVAEVLDVEAGTLQLPPPPSGLTGKAADSVRIQLLWDFKGSQQRGIWGYHVWRKAPHDTGYVRLTSPERPVITMWLDENLPTAYLYVDAEGLEEGKAYSYRVSSVDVFGREGPWSDSITVVARDARPLLVPYALIARMEGDSVLLSWEASPDPRTVGYHVYRWPLGMDTARVRVTISPLPATQRVYVDRPGELPTEYVAYAVSAVAADGSESDLSLAHAVPVPDIIPPPPPRFFMGYGEIGRARLRWTHSAAPDVWGYEVSRSLSPTGEFTLVSPHILADTTFVDELTPEAGRTSFWYRVRAVDRRGNRSEWTPAVLVLLPDIVPPPVPYFTAARGEDGAVVVEWDIGSAPDLLGFWLNRYADTLAPPVTLNNGDPIPAELRQFRDSLVEPGQLYWYELVAIDSAFNLSMPSGRIAAQAYSTAPPAVPVIDSAYSSPEGVVIVWSSSTAAEASVVIERSSDGENFLPISPLLPTAQRRFVDQAARPGQTYYYRLRLRSHRTGNWSAPSAVVMLELR